MNPYILSLIYLCATFAGLLAGSILIFYRRPGFYRYNYILGTSFIFSSLAISVGFLYLSDLIYEAVHAYRLGNALIYLALPLSYLYIRNVVRKGGSNWVIAALFLPFVLYMVDFFPYFLSSTEEKLRIIDDSKKEIIDTLAYEEAWLAPPYVHLYLRPIFMFVIWALQLSELLRLAPRGPYQVKNKTWLRWIWMYQFYQTFYWLPTLIFVWVDFDANLRIITGSIPMGFFVVINIYLFFNPTILYGRKENLDGRKTAIKTRGSGNGNHSQGTTDSALNHIPEERIELITDKLEHVVSKSKAYLNQGYSLHNLATDLNESPRVVSTVLNTKLNTNFSEYINRFRIEHSIQLIENGEHKYKTIEALGYECGFSNRTSFITAFKKYTQVTPSNFIKSQNRPKATSN